MPDLDDVIDDLKQTRDELRLKIHLASMEVQEEWNELEKKTEHFKAEAKLGQTGDEVGKALGDLGHELKKGYDRLKDAVRNS